MPSSGLTPAYFHISMMVIDPGIIVDAQRLPDAEYVFVRLESRKQLVRLWTIFCCLLLLLVFCHFQNLSFVAISFGISKPVGLKICHLLKYLLSFSNQSRVKICHLQSFAIFKPVSAKICHLLQYLLPFSNQSGFGKSCHLLQDLLSFVCVIIKFARLILKNN